MGSTVIVCLSLNTFRVEVPYHRNRVAPSQTAVGRSARQQGVVEVLRLERRRHVVERQRQLVQRPIGAEREPRIGCPLVVAGAYAVPPEHYVIPGITTSFPARSAVEADTGHETPSASVGPAVLLPDAGDVGHIRRVDVDPGLHLAVEEHRSRLVGDPVGGAARDRAWCRRPGQAAPWRDCQPSPGQRWRARSRGLP